MPRYLAMFIKEKLHSVTDNCTKKKILMISLKRWTKRKLKNV